MSERKTAIVLSGGGMRSTHGAGFLYALGTMLGITKPDIVVASSGNAGNALYYIAGQYEFIRRAWTEALSAPAFISYIRPRRIMDIDWLVDTVFKKKLPLDVAALKRTPIKYFIPATNARSGATQYWTNGSVDPFELLRAAKALPVLYGRPVPLLWREYIDGELGASVPDHITVATNHGATHVVALSDSKKRGALGKYAMALYGEFAPHGVERAVMRELGGTSVCATSARATLLCIEPTELPAHEATRDRRKLIATFNAGVEGARAHDEELRRLFS